MKESMTGLMKRVNGGISKTAANNARNFWLAVMRADMSESAKVTFTASDYAIIYKYAEACAKKAGLI